MSKLKGQIEFRMYEEAMVSAVQTLFDEIIPLSKERPKIVGVRYSRDLKVFIIDAEAPE